MAHPQPGQGSVLGVRSLASLRIRLPRNPGSNSSSPSHFPGEALLQSHLVCVPVFLVRGLETSRVLCEKDPGRAEEKPNRGKEDFSRLGPLS